MSTIWRPVPLTFLALTLSVAACSDEAPDPAPDPAPDTAAEPSDSAGGSAAPPDSAPTTPVDVGDRSVEVTDGTVLIEADQASFAMPSGNIQCVIRVDSAVCQIAQKEFEPAEVDLSSEALGDCTTATADALTLLAGEFAAWTCMSETIRGQAALDRGGWWAGDGIGETEQIEGTRLAVLPYGGAVQLGNMICRSESAGVSCQTTDGGHGFSLAREDYLAG